MKPFVFGQHEKDRAAMRELHEAETTLVGGGVCKSEDGLGTETTSTTTPNGTSDDGCDGA